MTFVFHLLYKMLLLMLFSYFFFFALSFCFWLIWWTVTGEIVGAGDSSVA